MMLPYNLLFTTFDFITLLLLLLLLLLHTLLCYYCAPPYHFLS